MLTTKFWVNWPFGSGEEAKNRFSRWPLWQPSWISDRNDFNYFLSLSHPDASYQVPLAQGCRRSRLLKQLLILHDGQQTSHDRQWLITTASCSGELKSKTRSLLFGRKNAGHPYTELLTPTGICITKSCLFKYIENFTTKNWKFSDKNSDIFHISAKNITASLHIVWVLIRTASVRQF